MKYLLHRFRSWPPSPWIVLQLGVVTVIISSLAGLALYGTLAMFFVGNPTSAEILERIRDTNPVGIVFLWFIGNLLFGAPVLLMGAIVGFVVWPPIWKAAVSRDLPPLAAAKRAAIGTAFFGGVVPFGAVMLYKQDFDSAWPMFFVCALVSMCVGPLVVHYLLADDFQPGDFRSK